MSSTNLLWLPRVLRAEGLDVIEFPGWRTRGHGDFTDIWGVICHHTGAEEAPPQRIAAGTAALAGPLAQLHLAQDGTVTVIAAGVTPHVRAGQYPGLPANDAARHTVGVQAVNTGTEGWAPVQYDALVRCCAAIVGKLGQPASHVIGHREWNPRKWDPGGLDLDRFRTDITARLVTHLAS
ncbi:peptidoglycan recognition protein family protein [Mycobacterium talmoniae]|uniref:N-acetylmuramoyl-L-alanine amidase domain-containing protein n=1 Tax=Mycobacterium talmoniae TaxID=1858794 RepID=A0A1S1NJH9_9MYCO|nr:MULTISPECIES: N-acetylmuramoyl-L-alanine amidase [Mycobacterium]OHV03037.1 hypothetical protein BKN37_15575 [Mycobacterium talmoniae]PQM45239.1 hypothetical protein C1Y40_04598 [Mycobacterium talmoniae]TDH50135.1 N-acetylmuramoyl-L-alanine amidase [Mycobacterium eburneum]